MYLQPTRQNSQNHNPGEKKLHLCQSVSNWSAPYFPIPTCGQNLTTPLSHVRGSSNIEMREKHGLRVIIFVYFGEHFSYPYLSVGFKFHISQSAGLEFIRPKL